MESRKANQYSQRWFSTFLGEIDRDAVEKEIGFLQRHLPRPRFGRVVDLCCGVGRHACPLAAAGYEVLGVDRDESALRSASAGPRSPTLSFIRADMRALPLSRGGADAIICMWQSFGYFDDDVNRAILSECARALRSGGRLILDLYHREFHARRLGERRLEKTGETILEQRSIVRERLHVILRYDGPVNTGPNVDEFDWRVYTPEEMTAQAARAGLQLVVACATFDEGIRPSADHPRMQLVFSSPGAYL